MNSNAKTCLLGFTLGVTLFLPLWIILRVINKPEQLPPASPPPTSPLVVYSHRPWLLEGSGTNSIASFMFTQHEWSVLTNIYRAAKIFDPPSEGIRLPQGVIVNLSPGSFTNLMESLGREAVRTGQVWIVTGGGM